MQSQAWTRKDLQSALASWTELKHDTILYAKQVMAEMAGAARKYAARICGTRSGNLRPPNALAQMTRNGLQSRTLLSDTTKGNLDNLIDLLTFLQSISEKELASQQLSPEENLRIQYFGGELEGLTLAAADRDPTDPSYRNLQDQKGALVADVASGFDANGNPAVLEEGVGEPSLIFVVLPDSPGESVSAQFIPITNL